MAPLDRLITMSRLRAVNVLACDIADVTPAYTDVVQFAVGQTLQFRIGAG